MIGERRLIKRPVAQEAISVAEEGASVGAAAPGTTLTCTSCPRVTSERVYSGAAL